MKALKTALIAGVAATAVVGFASAASAQVAYNAGVASDYIFRGIDQTADGEGQVFVGADYTAGPVYAGTWISNTGGDSIEYDLYAGYKAPLAGATVDLGVIYYGYTDGDATQSTNSNYELKAAVSVPAGGATLGAAAYWTPDFAATGEDGLYVEGNAAFTFANKLTLSGAVGQQSFDAVPGAIDSYMTYNVGLTFPLNEKLSVDARYVGLDDDGKTLTGKGDRGVVTLKAVF